MNKRLSQVRSTLSMLGQRRGNILTENIIFIILNLIFFTILILFIFSRASGEALIEEELAKQIALIVDSAKPEMIIRINVEKALEKSEIGGNIVSIEGNNVIVKLREKGGYTYSFFNDVSASAFPDTSSGEIKNYIITVNDKK
ncbi:MAG TPA: hypothetical protein VJ208_02495 [Candidatus Nanoarchaeia archaeon]|nr:hypothetical protein [Candidatus Nanoarchaeia archaeon]